MYPKRLTIEMAKQVTVNINSFNRESGIHSVMLPRQILFKKKFKTTLCKISKLVTVYNMTTNNKVTCLRLYYVLYIRLSEQDS